MTEHAPDKGEATGPNYVPESAMAYFRRLSRPARGLPSSPTALRLFLRGVVELAEADALRYTADFEAVEALCRRAATHFKEARFPSGVGRAELSIGSCVSRADRYREAERRFRRAATHSGDDELLGVAARFNAAIAS